MSADELVADLPTEREVPGSARSSSAPRALDVESLNLYVRAKFGFVRGFLWAWARLLSLRGLYAFGIAFGTCEWLVDYKRRRRIRQRIAEVFAPAGPPESTRWAVWRHFARSRCDKLVYLIFDLLPREKILRRVRFHGREHLDRALEKGHGAVIVLNHSGPHHVALLLMALLRYRVIAIRDRKEGSLRRYVMGRLEDTFPEVRDVQWFFADDYPRDLYRRLREGYVLSGALDVSRDRGGAASTSSVHIFGREQAFLNGTIKLAVRCGAPVLQGFIVSRRNYYYRLIVTEPLIDPEERDKVTDETIDQVMQKYADHIQDHVRLHPCQLSRL